MRVLLDFARLYPRQSLGVLAALLVAGTFEGASMSALLPMLSAAVRGPVSADEAPDHVTATVVGALERLGLTPGLGVLIAVVVVGLTARSALLLLANRQVGYTVARVATDLRLGLLRALLAARWEYFLRQPVGMLANAMSAEAQRAAKAYLEGATLVANAIQLVVYAAVALWVSWSATLIYLAGSALMVLLLQRLIRIARKAGRRQQKLLRGLLAGMTDNLQSVKSLKAMAREESAHGRLVERARRLDKAIRREVLSREALKAAQQPVFALLVGVGAWVGLVAWELPVATVMVLLVLLVRMLSSIGKVQGQYQNLVACEPSFRALRATIAEAERQVEPAPGSRPPRLEREIRFERVDFSYDDEPVLRDVDLRIPAGQLTTLVGFSGAGKTTVVDLVIGLLRPRAGEVRVDGVPLHEMDARAWRRAIGYVPQEHVLLHDTILHNVTLGDPSLGEADAERALRAAGAWDFVVEQPDGLHTPVGERGSALSGGQRQRILLARALVHEPQLLILDEATSALDPETEREVWRTLAALRGRMTLLAISHRPALVDEADRVYRLEKGRAVLVSGEGAAASGVASGR